MARSSSSRRARGSSREGGGQATLRSSAINMLNTLLGAGILAMPLVAAHMGIMLAALVLVWSAFVSALGLYLQTRCARYVDRGSASFFALAQLTYPNAAVLFDAAIVVKCFGVGVSYLIIIGDLMPGVVLGLASHLADSFPYFLSRNFWITVFVPPVMMLCFFRRVDSLKYTSLIALVSIGYLVILVVYNFAAEPLQDRSSIRVFSWAGPVAALRSFPVIVFAYTCHQNMFTVLNEMKDDSAATVLGVVIFSIGPACVVYMLVAIAGYLTFGNNVAANIMSQYPNGLASTVGKIAIVVLEMFSVPLQVHPCRASLDSILKWRPRRLRSEHSPALTPPRTDHASVAISDQRFAILTCIIIVLSYTAALSVHSLDRVLAYVGSTGSTSISFILPGLFYYNISNPDSPHNQRLLKSDDGGDVSADSDDGGTERASSSLLLHPHTATTSRPSAKHARKWNWDLDHLDPAILRKSALGLASYGVAVMAVCLTMNIISSLSA